jgi:hypothetical protein
MEDGDGHAGLLAPGQERGNTPAPRSCDHDHSRHLRNVFQTGELGRDSVIAFLATAAADGKISRVGHFNLEAILSVGYRVNSRRGTQFRIWTKNVLRDHLIRGYSELDNISASE